jgi:hypothetical protein
MPAAETRRVAARRRNPHRSGGSNMHLGSTTRSLVIAAIAAFIGLASIRAAAPRPDHGHTTTKFVGVKANTGTVSHSQRDGKDILTLSSDFKSPETPDPHWQVIDSEGNAYLLQRLMVKPEKGEKSERLNRSITLPRYIRDVAKIQIWCAWAETSLGEAVFEAPIETVRPAKKRIE